MTASPARPTLAELLKEANHTLAPMIGEHEDEFFPEVAEWLEARGVSLAVPGGEPIPWGERVPTNPKAHRLTPEYLAAKLREIAADNDATATDLGLHIAALEAELLGLRGSASAAPQPPIDNAHVAPGCEQFSSMPSMGTFEAALRGLACQCHGDTEGHEVTEHLTPGEREIFEQIRGASAAERALRGAAEKAVREMAYLYEAHEGETTTELESRGLDDAVAWRELRAALTGSAGVPE